MANQSSYLACATDWKVTSYGDIGFFAAIGGKLAHMKFYSPTLKISMNTAFVQVGVGLGVDITPGFLSGVMQIFDNMMKTNKAANAEKNYTALTCHRPFSLEDIDWANAGVIETGIAIPFGYETSFLHASGNSSGPAKGALIFSVPPAVDPTYGLKAEASARAGYFLGIDNRHYAAMAAHRKAQEMNRRPSDPLVRPMGGFQ